MGVSRRHDFKIEREALVGGQNPYAGILSLRRLAQSPPNTLSIVAEAICSSVGSRVISPTTILSQAWNTPLRSSTRRCCSCWGTKAAVRLSATIKSLKDNTTLPGHLPSLVSNIAPAVKASMDQPGDQLQNAIRRNVVDNVVKLRSATPILSVAVADGKLKVIGGIYRLSDGKVELID